MSHWEQSVPSSQTAGVSWEPCWRCCSILVSRLLILSHFKEKSTELSQGSGKSHHQNSNHCLRRRYGLLSQAGMGFSGGMEGRAHEQQNNLVYKQPALCITRKGSASQGWKQKKPLLLLCIPSLSTTRSLPRASAAPRQPSLPSRSSHGAADNTSVLGLYGADLHSYFLLPVNVSCQAGPVNLITPLR